MEIFRNFMHNKYLENTANAGFSQIDQVFLNIYYPSQCSAYMNFKLNMQNVGG